MVLKRCSNKGHIKNSPSQQSVRDDNIFFKFRKNLVLLVKNKISIYWLKFAYQVIHGILHSMSEILSRSNDLQFDPKDHQSAKGKFIVNIGSKHHYISQTLVL